MKNRVDREKGAVSPILVCGICRKPLYLSRFIREVGNRWFEHDGASPECPWYAYNKLSPDQRRALIYRGQQEGETPEHQELRGGLPREGGWGFQRGPRTGDPWTGT